MARLQIPYRSVLLEPQDLDPADFDGLCRRFVETSRAAPVVIEVASVDIQYFVFLNEGQLYWASANDGERIRTVPLREFFASLRRTQFPQVIAYGVDMVLYHSLLVSMQKEAELTVASTLVDLDELLARIEKDRTNAILTARDAECLIVLRCQNGAPAVCYHGRFGAGRCEQNPRDEFLVAVYTISARHPLGINLYTDLSVTHANDVRSVPAGFTGSISSLYLSQPPRLVVRLKGRPLKTYQVNAAELTIGRLPDNDIMIDNLSVSRKHAAITAGDGGYIVRDLASKNGTMLNGSPITSAQLTDGDVISVGKYDILFTVPVFESAAPGELDQTVVIQRFRCGVDQCIDSPAVPAVQHIPRLFRKSAMDDYPLEKEKTVIARARNADIRLRGLFAPRVRVEILRTGDDFVLHADRGAVRINGEEMNERILEGEDLIAIGSEEFVFKD